MKGFECQGKAFGHYPLSNKELPVIAAASASSSTEGKGKKSILGWGVVSGMPRARWIGSQSENGLDTSPCAHFQPHPVLGGTKEN